MNLFEIRPGRDDGIVERQSIREPALGMASLRFLELRNDGFVIAQEVSPVERNIGNATRFGKPALILASRLPVLACARDSSDRKAAKLVFGGGEFWVEFGCLFVI